MIVMRKLCECNCGGLTPLAMYTNARLGYYKGKPLSFIRGHNAGIKKGSESHAWRGGKTPKSIIIRQSKEHRSWAKQVKERDNYTCQECGKYPARVHSHHIKSFAKYPELRFDLDNGITLCIDCHSDIHGRPIRIG